MKFNKRSDCFNGFGNQNLLEFIPDQKNWILLFLYSVFHDVEFQKILINFTKNWSKSDLIRKIGFYTFLSMIKFKNYPIVLLETKNYTQGISNFFKLKWGKSIAFNF